MINLDQPGTPPDHLPNATKSRRALHTRVLLALSAVLVFAVIFTVSASVATPRPHTDAITSGSGAGNALPIVADPAPPPDKAEVPATVPTSVAPLGVAGTQEAKPKPAATNTPATPKATKHVPTAKEQKAIDLVEYWWDVFRLAYVDKGFTGTKLTKAQLRQPEIVIVDKASCKQPASNLLGPKSRKSLTYCNGKLELVPKVFMTITDPGQLKVVASGFLYHALANASASQRAGRSNAFVLGCLQGGLAAALLQYQAISGESGEEVWVVISPNSSGEDLHEGFVGTITEGGRWPK